MSRAHHSGKEPSQRMLRVGELIRHAVAEILNHGTVTDDVLEKQVITVPQVRLSPDLKLATCYVMPLGGKNIAEVLKALEKHKKFLRGEVARMIDMKFTPELRFREDDSFEYGSKIDALLRSPEVARDVLPETGSEGDRTVPPDDDEN